MNGQKTFFADGPRFGWGILAILFLVLLLQALRGIVVSFFPETVICNPAGPWGVPLSPLRVLIFGVCAFFFLAIQWWRESGEVEKGLWFLLLGAGASNVWERLSFGCVTDYFSLGFSFNVADAFLTIGILGLLWQWWRSSNKELGIMN